MMTSLGVFLNTVGLEPIQYSQRFTFGQGWLSGGINLIVVVLGLFAISQAFILLRSDDDAPRPTAAGNGGSGGLSGGFRELLRHKRVAGTSSAIGVSMGMIPGAGEFTALFAASDATRPSGDPLPKASGLDDCLRASV